MSNQTTPDGYEVCGQCGGYGGEPGSNFGDYGWHPCYRCGATGYLPAGQQIIEPEPSREYTGYRGEWDAEFETEATPDIIPFPAPESRADDPGSWEGEELPF